MADTTGISWTDSTHNPWSGCFKLSAGCKFCYAAALPPSMRRNAIWGPDGARVRASAAYLAEPHAWSAKAAKTGVRRRVFCASVADVFEDRADLDPWREDLWTTIAATPWLDWQLVTKRPHVAARWAETHAWPANAWLGTSIESAYVLGRIDHIRRVPAAVRFLSVEPLLGDIPEIDLTGIAWVITGGESGRSARPMDPAWALSLLERARDAGAAPFHKQMGSHWAQRVGATDPKGGDPAEWPEPFRVREFPPSAIPASIGAHAPAPALFAR